jgi:rod shape-determining protein MreD
MSYKKAALLYGIAFIMQFSVLNLFSFDGLTPNLILCLMIFITFKYNDGFRPALLAIPFALLSDLTGGLYFGMSALVLFLLCLAVSYFGKGLNRENLWTLLTVTGIGTVIYYFFYWIALTVLGTPGSIIGLLRFLLIALPMNLIVTLLAIVVFARIYRRKLNPTGYAIVNISNRLNKRNNKINLRNIR